MSSHDKDLVFLILQYLDEECLKQSAHMYEMVLNGYWEEAERYLSSFTKVEDNRYSIKIYFKMRKQNFLEALDNKDQEKALNILSKDLNVFTNVDGGLFNEMTQLLTLEDIRQHESLANYGDTNSARRITMIELKRVIEANPIFHGKLNFPTMNVYQSLPQSVDNNAAPSQASPDPTFAASTSLSTQSNESSQASPDPTFAAITSLSTQSEDEKPDISGEVDDNPVIMRHPQSLPLPLPSYVKVKKISRLIYYNSGDGILALGSNGVHLRRKWPTDDDLNQSGQATTMVTSQLWKPKNSLQLLINDISDNGPEVFVSCFALSKNDSYLISTSRRMITLFNLNTYKVTTSRSGDKILPPAPAATCIAFYPEDNNIIVVGMDDSTILIYNVPLAEVITKLKGHSEGITGLAFSSALNIMVEDTQISVWNVDKWEKQKCKFLQMPDEKMQVVLSATYIQFHHDHTRFLVVHETQLAIYEAKELNCLLQWTPVGSVSISQATFSCDSQMVYAGFVDGTIFVFDASKLELKCTVGCVIEAYPNAIASHPQKPT
ncbi:hypothetical protein EZV62_013574 [Acer yangbiense]|uniref:CTLH domain-containing protein n=1 Tax=Acer yangbiense TaxID=1000413 RepID=A0A5C7HYN5_9ROSI|nr:hypothetical protein EZV62_013574 [Acer yangbiense]